MSAFAGTRVVAATDGRPGNGARQRRISPSPIEPQTNRREEQQLWRDIQGWQGFLRACSDCGFGLDQLKKILICEFADPPNDPKLEQLTRLATSHDAHTRRAILQLYQSQQALARVWLGPQAPDWKNRHIICSAVFELSEHFRLH
jgi:DNA-binding transcriptional MerR regulator